MIANIMSKCYTFSLQRIILTIENPYWHHMFVITKLDHSLYVGFTFHLLAT
jgi:hypothetical protein